MKIIRELKNKKKINVLALLLVLVMMVFIALFASKLYDKFFTLKGVKGEEFINSEISPNGQYEARAYMNNETTDYAVLVVLIDLNNKTEKNIFWDYPCDEAIMKWVSNEVLKINDITLSVPDETYDFRR